MIRPGKIIKADSIYDIPEIKLSKEDEVIKYLGNKTLTPEELTKKLNIKSHGLLSEMVRYGKLERVKCESCNVGVKYRRKNVS